MEAWPSYSVPASQAEQLGIKLNRALADTNGKKAVINRPVNNNPSRQCD
jgi:hypothetical protein